MGQEERAVREWPAVAGLFLLLLLLAVVQPLVLVGVPLAFLALVRGPLHVPSLVTAGAALWLVFSTGDGSGIWFLERGWALLAGGIFAVLVRWWGTGSFLPRGLLAVAGAGAATAVVFTVWPQGWMVAEWLLAHRIGAGVAVGVQGLEAIAPSAAADGGLRAAGKQAADVQAAAAPALLGLSTLVGLGLAWWIDNRFLRGTTGSLAPLRSFRFPDGLLVIFVAGLALVTWLVVVGGEPTEPAFRLGINALAFMGVLYALRGLGVFLTLTGGLSWSGGVALGLALVVAAPFVAVAALALGLGDTWMDLRARYGPVGTGPGGTGPDDDYSR